MNCKNNVHNWINTVLIVLVLITGLVGSNQPDLLGGDTNFDSIDVTDGYKVDGTAVIDGSGNIDGAITSSTGSFTGDVGVGTTSPSDNLHVEDSTATTTLIISTGGASKGGRIVLEDHDGAGCSEIAILNGTVAAKTVTCPTGI